MFARCRPSRVGPVAVLHLRRRPRVRHRSCWRARNRRYWPPNGHRRVEWFHSLHSRLLRALNGLPHPAEWFTIGQTLHDPAWTAIDLRVKMEPIG